MRTSMKGLGPAIAALMLAVLAACGGSGGVGGGDTVNVTVDSTEDVSEACLVSGYNPNTDDKVYVDLCANEDYVQPSIEATANGKAVELRNKVFGDSVNCFGADCEARVQDGDKFTIVCLEGNYFGVTLDSKYQLETDNHLADLPYWTTGYTSEDDDSRFTAVAFIHSEGFHDFEEVRAEFEAMLLEAFGEDFPVNESCGDVRTVIHRDQVQEYVDEAG